MSGHTSGPWAVAMHLSCFGGDQVITVSSKSGDAVVWPSGFRYTDNYRDNARLISKAPELLTFAEKVFRTFLDAKHQGSVEASLRDEAKALIDAATTACL